MFSGGHMPEYFSLNDKISIDIRVCLLIKPKKKSNHQQKE